MRRRSARVMAPTLIVPTAVATVIAAAVLVLAARPLAAEDSPPVRAPAVAAIVGARIVIAPGEVIEEGTVVIRDGVIAAVGAAVEAPPDARIWPGEELTVYPGLIEPYWPLAAAPEESDGPRQGAGAPTGAAHSNAVVHPERDPAQQDLDPEAVTKLRQAGFTTALVAPGEGLLRGRAMLINLGDGDLGANLLRRDAAVAAAFEPGPNGYPRSLMGAVALLRQTFLDAAWYGRAHAAWAARSDQRRPPVNLAYEALAGAVAGTTPVIFETRDVTDTLRVARVAGELDLEAWVAGNGEEYRRLDAVAATGLPHLLPLAFPAPPSVEDGAEPTLAELTHWHLAPTNPARLVAAGLPVAFTSYRLGSPGKIFESLARATEEGLSPEDALAALTTTPARLLGLDEHAGTIAAGKMANLIVVDGDLVVEKPKLRAVWIDGRRYPLDELKPPEIDPAGTWAIDMELGDEQVPMVLELAGPAEALTGSIEVMGTRLVLQTTSVSGNVLTTSVDATALGFPGGVEIELTITGETASGKTRSARGSSQLTGRRTAKPPEETR